MLSSGRSMDFIEFSASKWVDDEVEIYWGVPMNASYSDGADTDRYGNKLTPPQQTSLESYRLLQRMQWREDNKDTIIGDADD